MCGPFVAFYAGADRASGRRWLGHLAYNGGRLWTYVVLGALAGAIGAGVDLAGSAANLQRLAALIAGAVMVVWGAALLLPLLGLRVPGLRIDGEGRLGRALAGLLRRLQGRPPVFRALALGSLTVLLPCGWLYAFVVSAAGTGSAWRGAALMAAFWLGTVPVMLGLGLGVQRLGRWLGRTLPAVSAVALIVIGIVGLLGRSALAPMPATVAKRQNLEAVKSSVQSLKADEMPCCKGRR
jgi:sulfite exporter TauE/SafE